MSLRGYNIAIGAVSVAIVVLLAWPHVREMAIHTSDAATPVSTPTPVTAADTRPAAGHPEIFSGVYRTGRAIAAATDVGVNYPRFSELLQSYAAEVAIANDAAKAPSDRDVLRAFAGALSAYKAAATVWQVKISASNSFYYIDNDSTLAMLRDEGVTMRNERVIQNPDVELQRLWANARVRLEDGNARARTP